MEYPSSVFAALSDPVRLRCLALMALEGELCVCEFTQALAANQPKVSKHLAVLRDAGLVTMRREAQWVLYALAPHPPAWVAAAVAAAVAGARSEPVHGDDVRRLKAMSGRPRRVA